MHEEGQEKRLQQMMLEKTAPKLAIFPADKGTNFPIKLQKKMATNYSQVIWSEIIPLMFF